MPEEGDYLVLEPQFGVGPDHLPDDATKRRIALAIGEELGRWLRTEAPTEAAWATIHDEHIARCRARFAALGSTYPFGDEPCESPRVAIDGMTTEADHIVWSKVLLPFGEACASIGSPSDAIGHLALAVFDGGSRELVYGIGLVGRGSKHAKSCSSRLDPRLLTAPSRPALTAEDLQIVSARVGLALASFRDVCTKEVDAEAFLDQFLGPELALVPVAKNP